MNTKQVIVMRRDLNMRKGKMVAQGCHAAMSFFTERLQVSIIYGLINEKYCCNVEPNKEISNWINNSFRKICVGVDSEEELLKIHDQALGAGLMSHLVTDNGATEFGGVPTNTCVAIGPHWDDKFEGITDHLPLL